MRLRREKRVKIERGTTQIVLGDGEVYPCRVLNLSLSGAALEIDERPAIGEQVRVGRTDGPGRPAHKRGHCSGVWGRRQVSCGTYAAPRSAYLSIPDLAQLVGQGERIEGLGNDRRRAQ